ncbi:MAG: IS200/IS605 family transposase [Anaerolineae bacterium]|nr:MAG: IS200/IS605 family transposase [Anaerolineae bacterium]
MDTQRARHAVYQIAYHFVWIPKDRRPVLVGRIAKRLVELIYQKTKELGGEILNITVQPDHVHLSCCFPPNFAPDQIMYRLRGYTAHELRKEFPELKSRLPNLWTRAYYVGTAGNVSASTIQRYIDAQKGR